MQDDLVNKVLDSAIENFRRQSRTSSYKSNPRQWCKDVLGIDLWSKQEDQFLALLENDHVAVATLLSHKFHLGITGCLDGGAGAGGVIHALVHAEGA